MVNADGTANGLGAERSYSFTSAILACPLTTVGARIVAEAAGPVSERLLSWSSVRHKSFRAAIRPLQTKSDPPELRATQLRALTVISHAS